MKTIFHLCASLAVIGLMNCSAVNEPTTDDRGWIAKNNGLPDNTTVTAITSVPDTQTLFIGTHDGVYKSTDNGEHWSHTSSGLAARDISCLAVDDAGSQTVYAGAWGGGVFRSTNGGETWQSVWSSDKNPHVNAIYVASDHSVHVATEHGLFKSVDAGNSWRHIFNYGKIKTVAVFPQNPNTIYIGARWHGNFRSIDGGATWHKINTGVYRAGQDVAAANRFVFDPQNPNHIFMSTGWVDLYHSINGGETWERIGQQLSERSVRSLAVSQGSAETMWAVTESDGVFLSRDASASWSAFNKGLERLKVKSLHVAKTGNGAVFVGALGKGIYKYVGE